MATCHSDLSYPGRVKLDVLLLAACVLCLPITGCKSSGQNTTDAATNNAPSAHDADQPDVAPDGIGASGDVVPSLADTPSQRDVNRADAPGEAVADTAAVDALGSDAGCSGWTALARLSPAEVSNLIATSNPIVINVHIPYAGEIPGTSTSIPYTDVDAIETYLKHDHCADVVLTCSGGGMSQSAGNELVKRGYLRVRDLNGGMQAWQAAGYPLLMDGGT
jgi:rhodanese-related sulfurtransferase